MIGHQPLIALRIAKHKPAGFLTVHLDMRAPSARDWPSWEPAFPQVEIGKADRISMLDLRFVVDLYVVALAEEWSERFGELIDRIKTYKPKTLTAGSFDMETPIIWPQ
jgi:hypothetical protein